MISAAAAVIDFLQQDDIGILCANDAADFGEGAREALRGGTFMRAVETGRVVPEDVILSRHELHIPRQDFELLAGLEQRRAGGTGDGLGLHLCRMKCEQPNRGEKRGSQQKDRTAEM